VSQDMPGSRRKGWFTRSKASSPSTRHRSCKEEGKGQGLVYADKVLVMLPLDGASKINEVIPSALSTLNSRLYASLRLHRPETRELIQELVVFQISPNPLNIS
jgi:hypothetical protein